MLCYLTDYENYVKNIGHNLDTTKYYNAESFLLGFKKESYE